MSHVGYSCLMAVDREHVLRSAAALLTRKSTATMDEVAKAAGISRATLHRQFAGRDALVRALESLGIAECEAALDAARLDEGAASDAVRRLVREVEPAAGLLAFLYTENQLFEGEEQHAGWERLDARISALFRRGQENGEFRIDLTPAWLTEALYGLIASGAWVVLTGKVARKDFPRMIAELLLGGALRRDEPRREES
jgi:TetR/AcrR family transcriptional regulator, mexCD-oprJ operon repressor